MGHKTADRSKKIVPVIPSTVAAKILFSFFSGITSGNTIECYGVRDDFVHFNCGFVRASVSSCPLVFTLCLIREMVL